MKKGWLCRGLHPTWKRTGSVEVHPAWKRVGSVEVHPAWKRVGSVDLHPAWKRASSVDLHPTWKRVGFVEVHPTWKKVGSIAKILATGKVLHPVWKRTGSVGEVLARARWYIQHEKGLALLMNTYMEAWPTMSMKKGWLYRTSCDEKNHEIAHMMMTRDDPDRAMIQIQLWWLREIQIKWWSRSSSDDPNWAMI